MVPIGRRAVGKESGGGGSAKKKSSWLTESLQGALDHRETIVREWNIELRAGMRGISLVHSFLRAVSVECALKVPASDIKDFRPVSPLIVANSRTTCVKGKKLMSALCGRVRGTTSVLDLAFSSEFGGWSGALGARQGGASRA